MGGTPLPPFTDKIFGKKGVTDLGGTPPPPFTDKIRKVVFEVLPKVKSQNSSLKLKSSSLMLHQLRYMKVSASITHRLLKGI